MTVTRRSFVTGVGALAGAGTLGLYSPDSARTLDRALTVTAARAVRTTGTTLEQAAAPSGTGTYRRLVAGPGFPLVVRGDIVAGKSGRDDRRTGVASIAQVTDVHVLDAQSPMRVEFLHDITGSAFRPHEALGTQGGAALVRRINSLAGGPYTGRGFDCVVSTGDNTDNHEHVELSWFLALMSGGTITPNTGGPAWEGVQSGTDPNYYLPEREIVDRYKKVGFPTLPGFFERATAAHTSPGLTTPWYSVFGNHDDSIQGTLPSSWKVLADIYTGSKKFTGFSSSSDQDAMRRAFASNTAAFSGSLSRPMLTHTVTPDAKRRPFTPKEYMAAHLSAAVTGPGPVGHGFTSESVSTGRGYYTFRIAPGVTGIALDSTNRAGYTGGSLDDTQYRWLEKTLRGGSSRYYDGLGRVVKQRATDELFVLFSHHTSGTMNNLLLDPGNPVLRHAGWDVVGLLQRFPNVLAWVNGHTHTNAITPRKHRVSERSFWEINTASHIDFPQHARLVEVVDNVDGTLSLFTTLVEADAPYQGSYTSGTQADLAALYRELSFNDIHADLGQLGKDVDRNTELLLVNPLGARV